MRTKPHYELDCLLARFREPLKLKVLAMSVAAGPWPAILRAKRSAASRAAVRPAEENTSERLPATKTYGARLTTMANTKNSTVSVESTL